MIVISEKGMSIMNMQSDFKRYAASLGIRDPFKVSQDLFNKCVSHKVSVTYVDEQSEEVKIDYWDKSKNGFGIVS